MEMYPEIEKHAISAGLEFKGKLIDALNQDFALELGAITNTVYVASCYGRGEVK
jgi:hypothetical protein